MAGLGAILPIKGLCGSFGTRRSLPPQAFFIAITVLCASLLHNRSVFAEYDPNAPLWIRETAFSAGRPKGIGHFEPVEGNEFGAADREIYIYIEVANCKSVKDAMEFNVRLTLDVDVYYEDGMRIYSAKNASIADYRSRRKNDASYMWLMIENNGLKRGEYKVEMTVHDENSGKEAFALTKFRRI